MFSKGVTSRVYPENWKANPSPAAVAERHKTSQVHKGVHLLWQFECMELSVCDMVEILRDLVMLWPGWRFTNFFSIAIQIWWKCSLCSHLDSNNMIATNFAHGTACTKFRSDLVAIEGITTSSAFESWWRHQMETYSALLATCVGNSPVTGELPSQRPVTRSFDVFFDLCLNKRLSKQSRRWWFETSSHPLWRHCNAIEI